jgi:hypothetical protein
VRASEKVVDPNTDSVALSGSAVNRGISVIIRILSVITDTGAFVKRSSGGLEHARKISPQTAAPATSRLDEVSVRREVMPRGGYATRCCNRLGAVRAARIRAWSLLPTTNGPPARARQAVLRVYRARSEWI